MTNDRVKLDHRHLLRGPCDILSCGIKVPSSSGRIHFDGNCLTLGTGHLEQRRWSHGENIFIWLSAQCFQEVQIDLALILSNRSASLFVGADCMCRRKKKLVTTSAGGKGGTILRAKRNPLTGFWVLSSISGLQRLIWERE